MHLSNLLLTKVGSVWSQFLQCIVKASQDHPENNTLPIFHTIHDPRWFGGLLPPFQRQQSAKGARTVLASTFLPPQKLSSSSPYHPFSPRGLIDSCCMSHAWEEGSTLKMISGAPKDVEISQTGLNDLQRIWKYSELLSELFRITHWSFQRLLLFKAMFLGGWFFGFPSFVCTLPLILATSIVRMYVHFWSIIYAQHTVRTLQKNFSYVESVQKFCSLCTQCTHCAPCKKYFS